MKIRLLLASLFLTFFSFVSTIEAKEKFFDYARKFKRISVSPTTAYNVQEVYPNCTITVYQAGTLTLATIYADDGATLKANPFTASSDASFYFYAVDGRYDVKFSGTGITSPFTWSDVSLVSGTSTPSGPAGGDLSGTYPNPTVARLQGRSVSSSAPNTNDILKWNGSSWQPSINAATGSGELNVLDYGAIPNDSLDDTAAFNAMIAAFNTAGRGIMTVPAGDYNSTNCAFTAITGIGHIKGAGRTDANVPSTGVYGTRINCASTTANLFTVNSHYFHFRDLVIRNNAASAPTAGTGILVTNLTNAYQKVDFFSIAVDRFYDNIDVQVGDDWRMNNCWITSPIRYGVHIRNLIIPDTGGWSIADSAMVSGSGSAIAVFIESCGGAKIDNTNIVGGGWATAVKATGTLTGILLINNCSFENLNSIPVDITGWHSVSISNTEFGMWDVPNTVPAILFTSVKNSSITNNIFNAPVGPTAGTWAITLHNCEGIDVRGMQPEGYGRLLGITGTYKPYAGAGTSGNNGVLGLGLLNGWANVGAGFAPASVTIDNGDIIISGNIQGGTIVGGGSHWATLPNGYRPVLDRTFKVWAFNGGLGGTSDCGTIIKANGEMHLYQCGGNAHISVELRFKP